jgi:hypothetical protein
MYLFSTPAIFSLVGLSFVIGFTFVIAVARVLRARSMLNENRKMRDYLRLNVWSEICVNWRVGRFLRVPKRFRKAPRYIVAATAMLQVSDFHSRRARGLWKSCACSSRTDRVRVNKTQASRCYECPPLTSRCPLTKFRAAGCALFQNESSDVVWSGQTDSSI